MTKWCLVSVAVAMCWVYSQQSARADTVPSIGTQHFTDDTKITTSAFNTAVAGQPAPFNTFCGSDTSANCSATWTFSYSLPTGNLVTGATLTLGIYDIDSAAPGNQVGSFTLDGTDVLTSQLNVVSEAADSPNSFYNVLTITIPNGFFGDLQTSGSATFALTLSGPGLGILGNTTYNGAGLDFSKLDIASQPMMGPTPESATWLLLSTGILALGIARALLKHS